MASSTTSNNTAPCGLRAIGLVVSTGPQTPIDVRSGVKEGRSWSRPAHNERVYVLVAGTDTIRVQVETVDQNTALPDVPVGRLASFPVRMLEGKNGMYTVHSNYSIPSDIHIQPATI